MKTNYYSIAKKVSQEYQSHPGLIGILWIGSSSFGIEDKFADIDIRLLVGRPNKQFPMKQFTRNGINIEVDEMSWDWLMKNTAIDSEERWIREKSVILYDQQKKISKEFAGLKSKMKQLAKKQLWEQFKAIFYSNDIESCLKRNDLITSVLYFYNSIENIVKFVFIFNGEPVPPFKWRWYFLKKNHLLPEKTINFMNDILNSNESSKNKLNQLIDVEKQMQNLMIQKGYKKEQVLEHWRF